MADPTRPLALADLWLPGDALGGAMLRGWAGPQSPGPAGTATSKRCVCGRGRLWDLPQFGLCCPVCLPRLFPSGLDLTRPEVRDRAVRVLGPDLLPVHAAEIRGEITPGEAAGLAWASVLRREAGLPALSGTFSAWRVGAASFYERTTTYGFRSLLVVTPELWWSEWVKGARGSVGGEAGRAAADAAALAAGHALREPDGVLLLPLPDGVVGRLDTSR